MWNSLNTILIITLARLFQPVAKLIIYVNRLTKVGNWWTNIKPLVITSASMLSFLSLACRRLCLYSLPGLLLLTRINFNPTMDMYLHPSWSVGWYYLFIPKQHKFDVWKWNSMESNSIPYFIAHVIFYPCWCDRVIRVSKRDSLSMVVFKHNLFCFLFLWEKNDTMIDTAVT